MGRSRNVQSSADDDLSQRSKRKRASSSTGENLESASSGQGASEVKRALYHCNYCNKDISGQIRIKCAICPDFDLCVECFSVGAEVTPHKSNHPYRVMDNLSFPLTCPDWNADEEILLLEGIEMYGPENWADVAEHVATKSKAQCIDHYTDVYMNSPSFPLPDLSHVVGKNREELLAMAKEKGDGKKAGFPTLGDLTLKEDSLPSPPRVRPEEAAVGQPPCILTPDVDSGVPCAAPTGAVKKAAQSAQVKDAPDANKVEDCQPDGSFGVKKPKSSGEEGPSMFEMSGYNPKRQEFDPEYDNDAEQLLADMEFNDTDTEEERELKLRVLHIYNKRLDERKRRKDFIIERNLVQPDPLEKDLTPDERKIYDRYKVFMRFQTREEHDELIKTVLDEHRIKKRIQDLQDARDAGCRTSAEAERFIELKRKREAKELSRKGKEAAPVGPSSKPLRRMDLATGSSSPRGSGGKGKEPSTTTAQASPTSFDVWDVTGLPGADLLSAKEKRLCGEIQLLPSQYLKMQEDISVEISTGNISKKSDAHRLFQVDPSKIDRVYDMLVRKGIAPPST